MIEELKPFLKENVDPEQLNAVLGKLKPTIDEAFLENAYVNNDPVIRKYTDKKVGKSIETFKTNTLGSLVEEQVNTRLKNYKEESESEKQLRLINERLDKAESDRKREQHISKALEYSSGKIPPKYVHKLLGNDIDETTKAIDDFIQDFKISVNEEVDDRFKEYGRNVNYKANDKAEKTAFTKEEIAAMSNEELKKNWHKIYKK